jgi:uncharacterized protein
MIGDKAEVLTISTTLKTVIDSFALESESARNILPNNFKATRPVELLIIQPTPFCNINCRYCYLPDRTNKERISIETLAVLTERLIAAPEILGEILPVSWHAGEPMTMPVAFYDAAIQAMHNSTYGKVKITHSFQTNGTLLNDNWLELITRHKIRLGVSLDGPEFIHDLNRITRGGKGTHATIMKNIKILNENRIPFNVITVVTHATLCKPDEFYDFFSEYGIKRVALNIEEIELHNNESSLSYQTSKLYYNFLCRIFSRSLKDGSVQFRELNSARSAITFGEDFVSRYGQQTRPFGIVTCDYQGNIFSFSPELAGAKSEAYSDFILGNVYNDDFKSMLNFSITQKIFQEIQSGIDRCESTCEYYSLCRGGTPANKYFEHGTFDVAETIYCNHSRKAVIDAALHELEQHHLVITQ